MKRAWIIGLIGMATASHLAHAEIAPAPGRQDARIRTVPYQRDNVVTVWGTRGVSTIVVFAEDEKIETVALGDSLAWQAVPDQSKRYLFIKPLEKDAATNMTVVTRKRIYSFVLRAGGGAQRVVFKVRFTYPDDEADAKLMAKAEAMAAFPNKRAAENSTTRNFDYSYKGHVTVKPQIVFDDGTKTYFRFAGDVPGIFVVNADRTETLVNYRREGEMVVVDKTAGQWTMRNGDDTACVFNMRAKSEPAPASTEKDVQPYLQAQHAPEGNRLMRILSGETSSSNQDSTER
ncbi:P-type conjugative transfer protein VirB9 [Rhodoblastus sp.]|jgi:type IV secretion system protein VirB9|uniref:P-type conjugative transfer protein VirB9 n=1 Tax=Rhodoblastus sp. TaxID=1962975 RepID=UPI0025EDD72B|nr:P-type conjugative transfer protein VirB9 [Rhodoblastus sp.]